MSILGDDDSLLGSTPSGSEQNFTAALGRISGKLLSENLLRQGVDLTFRNGNSDPDLLYLDVNNMRVGINTDSPVYDLDVNSNIRTTFLDVTTQINIDNVILNSTGYISTLVGPLNVLANNGTITYGRMTSDNLVFNDNYIESVANANIILDPNGIGTVLIHSNTEIDGDLDVSGNIRLDGNLRSNGTVYVGDTIFDTVTVNPDFTQSVIPGDDILYDLGKSNKRWAQLHVPDWTQIGLLQPRTVTIGNQLKLDGNANQIFATQSNDDVLLNPDTGITYIERTKWQDNTLTNLNNTPLTFVNTGIGYVRLMGTNGFVVPAGPTGDQRIAPEVGETRWNTDLDYLECWDGTQWVVATGGGETVTIPFMEELGDVYALILG